MDVETVAENAFASFNANARLILNHQSLKRLHLLKEDMVDYITACKAVYDQILTETSSRASWIGLPTASDMRVCRSAHSTETLGSKNI